MYGNLNLALHVVRSGPVLECSLHVLCYLISLTNTFDVFKLVSHSCNFVSTLCHIILEPKKRKERIAIILTLSWLLIFFIHVVVRVRVVLFASWYIL